MRMTASPINSESGDDDKKRKSVGVGWCWALAPRNAFEPTSADLGREPTSKLRRRIPAIAPSAKPRYTPLRVTPPHRGAFLL